jgi:hypothetical protein
MIRTMRTTVNIQDQLLAEARVRARRDRKPLGSVIDDALRALFVGRAAESRTRTRVILPTGGGSGLQPGVDVKDKDALAELLGDNEMPTAARKRQQLYICVPAGERAPLCLSDVAGRPSQRGRTLRRQSVSFECVRPHSHQPWGLQGADQSGGRDQLRRSCPQGTFGGPPSSRSTALGHLLRALPEGRGKSQHRAERLPGSPRHRAPGERGFARFPGVRVKHALGR